MINGGSSAALRETPFKTEAVVERVLALLVIADIRAARSISAKSAPSRRSLRDEPKFAVRTKQILHEPQKALILDVKKVSNDIVSDKSSQGTE